MKIEQFTKQILSVVLSMLMILSSIFISYAAEGDELITNTNVAPSFASTDEVGIYAHATAGGESAEAWQKWETQSGMNSKKDVKYLFLPSISSDNQVELYNNYPDAVTIDDSITVEPYTSQVINYSSGTEITVARESKSYTMIIYKSDAEASVYVNDTTGVYTDCNGNTVESDFYSFLTANKENSVSGSSCAIVSSNGIQETTLKKIKGRGNTNWKHSDKKPFNLQFNSMTTIGNITSKKFSLISSAMDSTMLRNKIMYDLANEVGSPYAPNVSYIDFYINGIYRGCYLISQKVDLGKNSLVSLKDTSDDVDTDFSFLVEVDIWNYANDVYFVSDGGYHVVCKTPDLDGYTPEDESLSAKYNFIKSTYQKLEDALYTGTMSDLEKICDLDSLATMYLMQDFGKNCDGGYTSTYFTYNADEKKFYACPIWDMDSTLGAVDCVRDGCSNSTCHYTGWTTRTATYRNSVNPYGKAFTVQGTSASGQTFEELCKSVWKERFVPAIKLILGNGTALGDRLKSVEEYEKSISQARFNNYVKWNFAWYCIFNDSGLTSSYQANYDGEISYLKDWIYARANWISTQYGFEEFPVIEPSDDEITTIYFANTQGWEKVNYYVWNGSGAIADWPGVPAYFIGKDENGVDIYKAMFSSKYKYIIFNDSIATEQTLDLYLNNYNNFYILDKESGIKDEYGFTKYSANADVFTSGLIGDVNLDGEVNIKDVTLIQRYVAKDAQLGYKQVDVAETDKDGTVTVKDATKIQKYLVKLITKL
ncbi:MAG: CotH kinase family protein [Ruminococcus sp.]